LNIVIVHGSVETSMEMPYINGLIQSASKANEILKQYGDRLLAVEKALNVLEDNPLYNAGLGSVLNRDGNVEVDGSIMDGKTGKFAAVAAMPSIRYASSVAKKVLEETEHVVLAGFGATMFAKDHGFQYENCITEEQLHSWVLADKVVKNGEKIEFSAYTGLQKITDTVGCVLLDQEGRLAAGSSTGGSFFKLPGRVGDTPFIGGGIFASKNCAVVCTGRGRHLFKRLLQNI
jgi:beta-aspartyl-peptidase (threonine type)